MLKKFELARANEGKGCLGKADDEEPIFILRAQDATASTVIRHWADVVEARHAHAGTLHKDVKEKVAEARRLAYEMEQWPTRKLPD